MSCLIKTVTSSFLTIAILCVSQVQAQNEERRLFQPEDVHRLKNVGDISISPDGGWIAYRVGTTNVEKDTTSSDLFMVNWDGSETIQLTHTEDSGEGHPRFSPDGKYLAFVAARTDGNSEDDDDPKSKSQVWLLNRSGGEAQRITELPGGVTAFEWSPDSSRLVLVSRDPVETDEDKDDDDESHDTPKPIVIDRYAFKRDGLDWLGDQYQRMYLFDLQTREAMLLTPGAFDSTEPAWAPDGNRIAFTSKREGDPDRHDNSDIYIIEAKSGANARQLTNWESADANPVFSPDGKLIAYLQDGPIKYAGYDPSQLAVISVNGGKPKYPAVGLDRHIYSPQWSVDGKTLHFRVADDRITSIASVPLAGGDVSRIYPASNQPGTVRSYVVGRNGVAAVTSFVHNPPEIYRAGDGEALSAHNKELIASIEWASVEGFDSVGPDNVLVGSMLLKPPGYRTGRRYPTIAHVHGGPVSQDGYEFDAMSQVLAAKGYIVVNPNYRGSTGHGRDFTRAIYADWGNLEIQDIHTVVDNLVAEDLADPERWVLAVGVTAASIQILPSQRTKDSRLQFQARRPHTLLWGTALITTFVSTKTK